MKRGKAGPEDLVFTTKFGGKINSTVIKTSLKSLIGSSRFREGTFKGHSLRITGAVAMMRAGRTALEIQLLGDW
jgi:hypothetical protein